MSSPSARPAARLLAVLMSIAVLLGVSALLGASAHAAPATVTGSVYDSLGDPLSDVTVQAHPHSDPASVAASTTTDVDGGYTLALSAGSYTLTFTRAGYDPGWLGIEEPAVVTVDADGGVALDGEPVEEGLLDDVVLVSSTVHALSGTVQAPGGQALAGITVGLFADPEDEEPLATTSTVAGGNFTLPVRSGIYYLRFTDPAHGYVDRWYGAGEPEAVTVNGDLPLGAITLTAGSASTAYPIAGRVSDALGVGINNVTVTVTGVGATQGTATGTTGGVDDAAGSYSVPVLPGTYQVSFARTGFLTGTYGGQVSVAVNGSLSVSPADEILNNQLPEMVLASTPFTVNGTVADATSSPLSGITVRAHGDEEPITGISNGSGNYHLALPIGAYNLEFTDLDQVAPHFVTAWLGGSVPETVWVAQGGVVTIEDGEPISTLPTIRLAQADATTTYSVLGAVEDVNADPIDGVTVTATPIPGTNPIGTVASTVTGAVPGDADDGQFELALKAGSYQITVAANAEFAAGFLANEEAEPPTKARVVVSAAGVTVDAEPVLGGEVGVVVLQGTVPYPVAGSATDGEDGVGGITVEAVSTDDGAVIATGVTDSTGAFAFTGAGTAATTAHGLRIGTYKLRFTDRTSNAVRYRDAWFGGEIAAEVKVGQGGVVTVDGESTPLLTRLTAASADSTFDVVGLVYDPYYEPLDGVTVTASPLTGGDAVTVLTGPDATFGDAGVYRLALRPGRYRLAYSKAGYQTEQLVHPETGSPVTVTVGATGTITAPGLELYDGLIDDVQLFLPAAVFAIKPKLTGKVAVGQTLTVDPGSLVGADIDKDSAWVEWFLDGRPADDFAAGGWGQKFKVPVTAGNRALTYTLTIDDPEGLRASTVFTSKPVTVPKAPASVKASVAKAKLTVTVTVPTWSRPTGTLVVKDGKKVIATITLKPKAKGRATVSLAKLKRGKHKLTVSYTGPANVQSAKTKLKYKK
ncbi:carboxypeptidase regulatory-like domain-containing protein [Nocardioides sp. Bht2]|uniref:carboxypeptidase regulatory-like domain-containing protein n=1 Tax=Nocardioides sp. Bht2 TaxID=3392297 RepID=UPI0039B47A66